MKHWSPQWDHWYRRALPAYWVFLFCLMHFPAPEPPKIPSSDKIAHLTTYGLLAFLLWRFVQAFDHEISRRFAWVAAGCLFLYAALDEYLQGFVNRSPDVVDWLCDVAGISLVLALLEFRRRREACAGADGSAR